MSRPPPCRRKYPRFPLSAPYEGTVEFEFPDRGGTLCTMDLLDVSRGGISFVLAHELPGLEEGESIDGARIHLAGRIIHGDFLVMHLSPEATRGAICGALFLPTEDDDILALRALLVTLEAQWAAAVTGG